MRWIGQWQWKCRWGNALHRGSFTWALGAEEIKGDIRKERVKNNLVLIAVINWDKEHSGWERERMTLVTSRLNLYYLGSILVDMFVDCWKHRSEGHRKDLNLMFGDVILNLILCETWSLCWNEWNCPRSTSGGLPGKWSLSEDW